MAKLWALVGCLVFLAAATGLTARAEAESPQDYFERALDLIEEHIVTLQPIDWKAWRQRFLARAQTVHDIRHMHALIREALVTVGNPHSTFQTPQQMSEHGWTTSFGLLMQDQVVVGVLPGSSADEADVQVRDVVVALAEMPAGDISVQQELELSAQLGETVELTLRRAEEPDPLVVTLEPRRLDTTSPQHFAASVPPVAARFRDTGYLLVPGFRSDLPETMAAFAAHLQSMIRNLDEEAVCGWVVDLRLNTGGNMWPMLALGPLLGEGVAGYFARPDEPKEAWTTWGYRTGEVFRGSSDGERTLVALAAPYRLKRPDPPVAVLTGSMTASSGEAVLVSFLGRPNTRTFGEPSHGVPSGNRPFALSDGAYLMLSVSWFADRTGRVHTGPIAPDEHVPPAWQDFQTERDPAIQAARKWLEEHDCE